MIKIIQGTFGFYDGKRVRPLTAADGAVDLKNPELEKRLIAEGVAISIDNGQLTVDNCPAGDDGELPEYSMDNTMKELQAIAGIYGVDVTGLRTKPEIIAAIDTVNAKDDPPDDEGDPPDGGGADDQPDLTPPDPV